MLISPKVALRNVCLKTGEHSVKNPSWEESAAVFGGKRTRLLSDSTYLKLSELQLNPRSLTLSWVETDEVFTLMLSSFWAQGMTAVCLLPYSPFHTRFIAPWCPWPFVASVHTHFSTRIIQLLLISLPPPLLPLPLKLQQPHAQCSWLDQRRRLFPLRGFAFVCFSPPDGGGRVQSGSLKNSDPCESRRERLMRRSRSVTCPPGAISLHRLVWRSEASGC